MFNFLNIIGNNLEAIVEKGGYFFLGLTTTLEGIPIIGQFVPGHTIIIIAGFLSKIGVMDVVIVSLIVVVTAMLGDLIGYLLGRKYGFDFFNKFGSYLFIKPEYLEKAKNLIKEHPAKTVILGRFSPITRPLSPFIVGASGINVRKFWFYDFIAVILWSLASVGVGYIFGASYHTASEYFGKFVLIAIIIGILVVWGYKFINKQFHIFAKYELFMLFFNLFGLYLFFKTVQDAITDKVFLLELDIYVNNFFFVHASDWGIKFMNIFTNIFSPTTFALIGVLSIIFFLYKKNYFNSLITLFLLGGGYASIYVIKNIVMRVRPFDAFVVETGFSFPSGHVVAATIFFTALIYLFLVNIKNIVFREISIAVCVVIILVVALSRVYLGVHWLSDVFAGIGFGLFYATSILLLFKYIKKILSSHYVGLR